MKRFPIPSYLRMLAFAVLLLLFGSSDRAWAGPMTAPVTLHLWAAWGIPDPEAAAPDVISADVVQAFQRRHPEIRLIISSGLKIQGPGAESGLLMALAGGTGPDVIYVNMREMNGYIQQGFLYPFDEFLAHDPTALDRVYPGLKTALAVDGHYYAFPWMQDNMALYYRKDLFRAAGLDPERPPTNWNEFYQYAQKLTDPDRGQYGFGFYQESQGTAWHWTNFLWQAGGEVMTRGADGRWQASFASPEGRTALLFYRKLVADPWKAPDGRIRHGVAVRTTNLVADYVARGRLGMWLADQTALATSSAPDTVNPALIGIAPLPAGPTGIKATQINAAMFGISALQKDPRVRRAAWEFIRFLGSEEADRIRARAMVDAGQGAFVNPLLLRQLGYDEMVTPHLLQQARVREDMLKFGKPEPYGGSAQFIYTELDQPLEEIGLYPDHDPDVLLRHAAARVNEKLLGYVDPNVLKERRAMALGAVSAGFLIVVGLVLYVLRLLGAGAPSAAPSRRRGIRDRAVAALFLAPALLSVALWAYYPLARGLVMAFQDYRVAQPPRWVGMDNFIEAATQDTFWWGMLHSIEYVGLSLGIGFLLPVFLAVLLNEIPRGKVLFRTLYYLPAVTSGLVILFLWKQFYDPTPHGLLNLLLTNGAHAVNAVAAGMHLPAPLPDSVAIDWLGNPRSAMLAVVLPGVWAGAGPGSIIYIAALNTIPDEYYEAAEIDGADVWRKLRVIVLPSLRPLLIINFIGAFIGAFKAMENIFVMTGGGPLYRTHTVGLEVWYNAFMYLKFGYATAAAWIMGAMLIGVTLYQLLVLRNVQFSGGRR